MHSKSIVVLFIAFCFLVGCGKDDAKPVAFDPAAEPKDEKVIEALATIREPKSDDALFSAITALAKSDESIAPLMRMLKDPDAKTRKTAAWALKESRAKAKPAYEALNDVALHDPDKDVRKAAADTLAGLEDALYPPKADKLPTDIQTIDQVIAILDKDPNPQNQQLAGQRLQNVTGDPMLALPKLIANLKAPHHYARQGAIEGLKFLGPRAKEAIPALEAAIKSDWYLAGGPGAEAIEAIQATTTTKPIE